MLRPDTAEASTADAEVRRNGGSMLPLGLPNPEPAPPHPEGDPYRGVVVVLIATTALGAALAAIGSFWFGNPVLFDAGFALVLAAGILTTVAMAQAARRRPPKDLEIPPIPPSTLEPPTPVETPESTPSAQPSSVPDTSSGLSAYAAIGFGTDQAAPSRSTKVLVPVQNWLRNLDGTRTWVLAAGACGVVLPMLHSFSAIPPGLLAIAIAAVACLVAAGLAATTARYFASIDPAMLSVPDRHSPWRHPPASAPPAGGQACKRSDLRNIITNGHFF
jgi:hypothetical protein